MTGASLFLPFLPMAPVQLLINNLLYDFSQVGIPLDRVDEEYLLKPRRWNIDSIKKFMIWIGPISSIFDYNYWESLFHTGWFVESLLTQTLIVHIIRTNRIPFIESCASPALILTTLTIMGIASFLPFSPVAHWLGLVPLPAKFWIWIALFLLGYSALTHRVKMWFVRTYGTD
jgi:Mg2+-importing ATPase